MLDADLEGQDAEGPAEDVSLLARAGSKARPRKRDGRGAAERRRRARLDAQHHIARLLPAAAVAQHTLRQPSHGGECGEERSIKKKLSIEHCENKII
jgi:hypothetical protein